MRKLISSGSPFEAIIGQSRAVRVGNIVAVAGTAPIGRDGKTVGVGDVYAQTRRCLEIVEAALADAGVTLDVVVRSRIMVTDIALWEDAARAHGEVFAGIRPSVTVMQVSRFIDPEWLVELEVDAVVED